MSDQPWISDVYSLNGHFGGGEWQYPENLVVGDTAIMIGKLFYERPDFQLVIGNASVKIIDTLTLPYTANQGGKLTSVQLIRFLITDQMGVGQKRPVTLIANGITTNCKPINILSFPASAGKTDTTFQVDSITTWMPDDAILFAQNYHSLLRSAHTDQEGNIFFDNKYGMYKIAAGKTTQIIKAGDSFNNESAPFSIVQLLGTAVTYDGNTIYFSAETNETAADVKDHYVFRLCKMNLVTRSVTTINRTLVTTATSALKTDGSPYQGDISKLQVVAANLNLSHDGMLFYSNYFAPDDDVEDHLNWYRNISQAQLNMDFVANCVYMICRLDAGGHVTVLMSNPLFYNTPGYPAASSLYSLDPTGKYVYGYVYDNAFNTRTVQYDVIQQQLAGVFDYYTHFIFKSYETDPALQSPYFAYSAGYMPVPSLFLPLIDGSVINVSAESIYNYDLQNLVAYCYAGTELGLLNPNEVQTGSTGKAKFVDFTNANFIGQDRTGTVYYCGRVDDYTNGVTFYKLHSKK
ncbi:hypothetical protein [Deminuibacter soli]|uniref:hypothetical protein n=1 Tax=Deminuibacter soli TaxID=2291815 RepID=UPI0011C161E4|nr:hypothetical protein [Deminuibacter soli]